MATKKKNPLEETNKLPFNQPDTRKSQAEVPPPQTPDTTKAVNPPKLIRDTETGKVTGVNLPDGRTLVGIGAKEAQFLARKYDLPMEETAKTATEPASPELISKIGQLSPEQQALANSNAELPGRPELSSILKASGEKAIIAAAGGLTTGATGGGLVAGPLGALAGGAALGAGAAITTALATTFSEYKKADLANLNTASYNYDAARTNMLDAITLANSGAGIEAQELAVKNYNQAIAQIQLAERQLKELSGDQTKYVTEIKAKLVEIEDFKNNDRGRLDAQLARALQKPTASFVNQGVTANG